MVAAHSPVPRALGWLAQAAQLPRAPASREAAGEGDSSSQSAAGSSAPPPKPSNSEAFIRVIPLPVLRPPTHPPTPPTQTSKAPRKTSLGHWPGPSYLHPCAALTSTLLSVVANRLQGGKQWLHALWSVPTPPGTPWGPMTAPSSCPSSPPTPLMALSLTHARDSVLLTFVHPKWGRKLVSRSETTFV